MPSIVALMGSENENARAGAMMLLSSLAPENAGEVVASGGIGMMIESLSRGATDQTLHTLAQLSKNAVHAVSIAQQPGALTQLVELVSHPHIRELVVTILSNLCALGVITADLLSSPQTLHKLVAPLMQGGLSPEMRLGLLSLLSRASHEPGGRQALATVGAPRLLVEAADGSSDAAAVGHGLQALAHLAADENFRSQLSGWGALRPLCASLSSARAPDPRTRAIALSAVANVSYVEPAALLSAGVAPHLASLLYETEPNLLRMALTALLNVTRDASAVPPHCAGEMLAAGAPAAVVGLLAHADADIRAIAVASVASLCQLPHLVVGLASAGAGVALMRLLVHTPDPTMARTIASAMPALLIDEQSRAAARDAGGAVALSGALGASTDPDARLTIVCALAALVGGDWRAAYKAAGWPPIIGSLQALQHVATQRADMLEAYYAVARGAAAALSESDGRDSLAADSRALNFVCTSLWALAHEQSDLAAGAASAHVALLREMSSKSERASTRDSISEQFDNALKLLVEVSADPELASALAAAGAPAALMPLLSGPHALVAARSLAPLLTDEAAREAACTSSNIDTMIEALVTTEQEEMRLAISLALAGLVGGDYSQVHAAGGWKAVVTVLAATAATASPQMATFASGALSPVIEALDKPHPASAAPTQPSSPAKVEAAPPPTAGALIEKAMSSASIGAQNVASPEKPKVSLAIAADLD